MRELTKEKTKFKWEQEQEEAFEKLRKEISSERTMAYFNPQLPIMVRTEAGFNEGLAAAIFQKHRDVWKPVHFISRNIIQHREAVQPNREGCTSNSMGKTEISSLPDRRTKIQDYNSSQATDFDVQQKPNQTTAKNQRNE